MTDLRIPPIPKAPAKGFVFEGAALHQAKQDLGKELVELFRWMAKTTMVPGYQDIFRRFGAAVPCPAGVRDLTRLPYQAIRGPCDTRGLSPLGCVYAEASFAVQLYWDLCIDGQLAEAEDIRQHIAHLRDVWDRGVDKCEWIGSPREGWRLV
jgi:hypothetical protein